MKHAQGWLLLGALLASQADAAVKNVRVVWDANPANEAIIGFSRNGTSSGQYLKFGTSLTENSWQTLNSVTQRTFQSSLDSYFVRLTNLTPATDYFFRACDSSGCTEPYVFRTAPATPQAMIFVAGGDSRTNRSQRQEGNRLVQKIRPHFIMFSGDYTDNHSASEMATWLDDWTLTFSPFTVNGSSVRQVHPIIPTVGNHEGADMNFMCTVFGVDADRNGSCSLRDSYFALNVGNLLRIYTLNTEFESSFANERTAQRNWLNADLPANANATVWRLAQYHRPMFPRSSSKPAVTQISLDWAQPFYDFRMNLVNESDTHIAKYTKPVKPNGADYQEISSGTVYIGEGAWGAPVRPADRSAAWQVDSGSFAHLNVIQATPTNMDIRTVYISGEAATSSVSKASRDADPLALPTGWSLWDAAGVGNVFSLKLAADKRTELNEGSSGGEGQSISLSAVRDVTVVSDNSLINDSMVYADGDKSGKQLRALLGWNVSAVPANASLKRASIRLNVTDPSSGSYNLYAMTSSWSESSARYSQTAGGTLMGSVVPSSTGSATLVLNSAGLGIVQGWINGSVTNHGVALISGGTTNGVDFSARENGNGAQLLLNYTVSGR
ncbi:DNRLRE domain-containing protein [Parachitinimonas caeni]|uniref:DNRLRE domain-containing protein n=1 Tax=Parachitinimonas caeni TaxID=3031301 RepID=A0ABT7E076_9NEIS|nr:DNRLRE domain-containing protein [Parachitinimonas caeni]MDK2125716.1 DNRLRE domain-containing protein [Parachitinimonas caeni]